MFLHSNFDCFITFSSKTETYPSGAPKCHVPRVGWLSYSKYQTKDEMSENNKRTSLFCFHSLLTLSIRGRIHDTPFSSELTNGNIKVVLHYTKVERPVRYKRSSLLCLLLFTKKIKCCEYGLRGLY